MAGGRRDRHALSPHARWLGYFGDDAYISFQYVKNFLHGHGLVYNVGERVEGYTDFLWVMLLSVVMAVFRNADIAAASVVLGLGFGVLSMALGVVMARRLHPGRRWLVLVAPLLMACQTSYCAWSTGGLESTMFGFFVLVAIYAQDRELRNASGTALTAVAAVLIALTRADGFVVVGALGLWRLYETWDPATSVVDGQLIHRVRNLVVLGGSVFPTITPANPTLTICALSLWAAAKLTASGSASSTGTGS